MPTDLSRYADWTTWLAEQGATDSDVRVVWVGGSAATGGYDEWSDLDVDLLCTPAEADAVHDRLVDVRRHGTPIVVHDPDGLVELRPDDEDELQAAIGEAVDLYLGFALSPLVRLLRVEHCPWRHDFGLRYLHEDLPPDVAARVTTLLPGAADPAEASAACFAWTDELLARRGRPWQPATSGGDPSDGGASRR